MGWCNGFGVVLDNKGKSHYLYNNSACGTWIGEKPDGSVVVGAAYDGCFVSKKDGEYLMTLTLEEISDGLVQYNKKDLKCPILPAMDAPSPSTCASIAQKDKLPCANAFVSQELCERIGCCFNPRDTTMPCYYGKKLTAQCSDNIVVAVSKDLTTPSLVLESVNVVAVDSASCPKLSILKSNSFVVFQFPLSCGAKYQVDESTMIYENIIEGKQDIRTWNGASLTRDSTMRVTVQCGYSRNAVLPLKVQVFTLPPPPPVSTTGPLFLEMRIAKDQQYSSYYVDGDYPVTRVLRDPVYLEVRILQRTDPNLVLILNDCWANPSPDETQQPQWPILVESCPFPGDNYLTQLIPLGASSQAIPFPTHYNHFSISTFTFVDGRTQLALGGLTVTSTLHCSKSLYTGSALRRLPYTVHPARRLSRWGPCRPCDPVAAYELWRWCIRGEYHGLNCKKKDQISHWEKMSGHAGTPRCGELALDLLEGDGGLFGCIKGYLLNCWALDHKGKARILRNNSACGVWVTQKSGSSVKVGATYDGCYVKEMNGDHMMTIILEEAVNGKTQHHKKDITCPIVSAMDAPAPSMCAAVARQDRLSCAQQSVSRDVCEGLGCCFIPGDSAMPCYFGKPLTAQCTAASSVTVAISTEMTTPSLILDSVHVLNVNPTSCPGLQIMKSNAFIAFSFPLSCGSMNQVSGSTIQYENTIEATRDIRTWGAASITRDSTMRVTVRCTYSRTGVAPLQVQVFTLPPPLPVSTTGPLLLEMRIARDQQYSSYYVDGDYPVTRVLRDPVYLEVRILQRTDPNLVLILNDCWANPSPDETQQPQWPILVKSCPFPGDNYLTQLISLGASSQAIPFPTHYKHFSISTFTFVDGRTQLALRGLVYFHCSASVCVPSASDSCMTSCVPRNRRMIEKLNPDVAMTISSDGPVNFIAAKPDSIKIEDNDSNADLTLAGGAIAASVILTITVVTSIWIHHRKNAPKAYTVKT
ncbi:zona pellucida sperm-binding 4-like [Pelobates cultripes]|uniref:Zona pellucida sperm-binding protein 4 n=1 Tax=Pelobates cultripes TaxID=61616 RepID=A0AAD1RQ74_PELCU|nr:zona pellucida sperm-binding 4-like [Pelobates cultripes]